MDEIGEYIFDFVKSEDEDIVIKSFEIIYKYYYNFVVFLILKNGNWNNSIKQNKELIFDDVYLGIFKNRKKFKIEEPYDFNKIEKKFKGWLNLVSKWKVLDFLDENDQNHIPNQNDNNIEVLREFSLSNQIDKILVLLYPLKKDIKKAVLFLHYVIEMPYELIAKSYIIDEPDNDISKKAAKLRQTARRACKKLNVSCLIKNSQRARDKIKRIFKIHKLSKEELKKERRGLNYICCKTCKELKGLIKKISDYNEKDKARKILLNGYINDLELWMEALES